MLKGIVTLLVALLLSGCDDKVQSVGSLSVGDLVQPGDAPNLDGVYLTGWGGCGDDTTVSSTRTRPAECVGRSAYIIIYRDEQWQYNVVVTEGRVDRIDRYHLDAWP